MQTPHAFARGRWVQVGSEVAYIDPKSGAALPVTITAVHADEDGRDDPFYTIMMLDGSEKRTVPERLAEESELLASLKIQRVGRSFIARRRCRRLRLERARERGELVK